MTEQKARIGINGFGRIGRLVLRAILSDQYPNLDVVVINSRSSDPEIVKHMFMYDSTYGVFNQKIDITDDGLKIDDSCLSLISYPTPDLIPWEKYGVDIVLECTGKFTDHKNNNAHISNGAQKVIISAPGKQEDITIVMGVNENDYDPVKHNIISNASCTTNCLAPLVKVINDSFGISEGMMTTIHAYTNDQRLADVPHSDWRRSRAAAENVIPTTTGAARAVGVVLPELNGKLDGIAMRVPVPDGSVVDLHNPTDMPDPVKIDTIEEPWIKATIIVPDEYLGAVLELCTSKRGIQINLNYAGTRAMVEYKLPLNEVVFDFYDRLKSITKGYASFDYELVGYEVNNLVKVSIMINGDPVDALSLIVHKDRSQSRGRALCERLKDLIPRQQFKVAIQAAIGGKIIARETVASFRKDVTQKLYGGDVTRKNKLLDKQKKGKKRMRQFGKVDIPQNAFLNALKMNEN